jgi:hypothetical protein
MEHPLYRRPLPAVTLRQCEAMAVVFASGLRILAQDEREPRRDEGGQQLPGGIRQPPFPWLGTPSSAFRKSVTSSDRFFG